LRIYTPRTGESDPLPILLYFHGGGWLYSSIEAVDRCARLIANEARAIVVSVDYRLAPEHAWPAANDDGEDAFLWTLANAARLGGDPRMVGVGGDSAGGNIALSISRRQLAAGRTAPAYQLLYYTSTDFSTEDESFRLFRDGYGLDENFRQFMISAAFPGDSLRAASRELSKGSYSGMPATIVVTAGFDMLRDSGRKLARRLEQDGVAVTYLNYPTLAHGFLQWSAVVADAERAAVDTARLFGAAIRSRSQLLKTTAHSAIRATRKPTVK
jgi:acetyl esterase/lipase